MLIESDGVLLPGLVNKDEVDGDVLPVIVMSVVHSKGVTAFLEAVPEMPGQLQEIPTADYLLWSVIKSHSNGPLNLPCSKSEHQD